MPMSNGPPSAAVNTERLRRIKELQKRRCTCGHSQLDHLDWLDDDDHRWKCIAPDHLRPDYRCACRRFEKAWAPWLYAKSFLRECAYMLGGGVRPRATMLIASGLISVGAALRGDRPDTICGNDLAWICGAASEAGVWGFIAIALSSLWLSCLRRTGPYAPPVSLEEADRRLKEWEAREDA